MEQALDKEMLALLRARRTVMFSVLAEAFPDYKWQMLFSALRRLRDRQQVELVPYRWDYQVVFTQLAAGR
jgi:hypothetical protein